MRTKLLRVITIFIVLFLAACQPQPATPEAAPQPTTQNPQPPSPKPTTHNPQPADTATTMPTTEPPDDLSPIADGLQALDIDTFFEESYIRLGMRCPECITALGMSERLGLGNDQLNDMSDAFIRETQELETAILTLLQTYDRDALTPEQQISYDVYTWYLEDQVRSHDFMYNDYVIRPGVIGYQDGLVHFFTDIHPVTDKEDAEDYVTRLLAVKTQMQQVVDGLERRAKIGVMLPRFALQWIGRGMRATAETDPTETAFYTEFEEKLDALDSISDADKQTLLDAAEKAVKKSVLPGFDALADEVEKQQRKATDEIGLSKFANGEEYYAYLLRHYTTTDLTADEIHALGKQDIARIHGEMRALFAELGYPENESLPRLYDRVAKDSGSLQGEAIVREYEAIVAAAQADIAPAFDRFPQAEVTVKGVAQGGYYVHPAVDGSRPGTFYATNVGSEPKFGMPTLAYHEAVPGHHHQIAIAMELPLPFFRNDMGFTGYAEGWALYAEQLAWELGWYEGDPHGDLGRLQAEAFRAVRLVVDTGIHVKGWTYDQAVDYMVQNTGLTRGMVEGQIWRYMTWPGQATAYKIGMLRILDLRQRTQDALGDDFDLKTFHTVIIGNGSVPLQILEHLVDNYITEASN